MQTKRSRLRHSSRMKNPEVTKEVEELTAKIDSLKIVHQRKELEREIRAMQARLAGVTRACMLVGPASEVGLPALSTDPLLVREVANECLSNKRLLWSVQFPQTE